MAYKRVNSHTPHRGRRRALEAEQAEKPALERTLLGQHEARGHFDDEGVTHLVGDDVGHHGRSPWVRRRSVGRHGHQPHPR